MRMGLEIFVLETYIFAMNEFLKTIMDLLGIWKSFLEVYKDGSKYTHKLLVYL